jgi:hypothetical protein
MGDDNGGLRWMISRYERGEIRFQTIVYFFLAPRLTRAPYEFTLAGRSNEMKGNLQDRLVSYKSFHVRVPAYNDN